MSLTVTATNSGGGSLNGMALTVKVLTGWGAVGNTASSGTVTAPQLAITPSATGSKVYGAVFIAGTSTAMTANGSTTINENQSDSGNVTVYSTFETTGTTTAGTPVTVGGTAPSGAPAYGIALCEIESNGSLAEDASSPASLGTTAAATLTTASFNPPAGSMLVASVVADGSGSATSGNDSVVAVTDSSGLTWTKQVEITLSPAGGILHVASVWTALVPGGSSYTGTDGKLASQAIPGLARPGAFIPGQVEPGVVVKNATVTFAGVTASAVFGGTKTGLAHLTANVTAHTVVSGTRTQFGHLTTTATATAAFTRTRVTFGHFTAAVTASLTAVRTRTTFGVMTAAATASAAFTRTRGTFGSLAAAVTAHLTASGTHPGHLTATVTAAMSAVRTRTQFGHLTSAATATAAFQGTKTALGHLTTAVTASMGATAIGGKVGAVTARATATAAFQGTKLAFGHLTSTVTASAGFTRTRVTFGSLTTAVTARLSVAGTKTALGHLTSTVTASAAFAGFRQKFGTLVSGVTASALFSAFKLLPHEPSALGGTILELILAGTDSEVTVDYGGTAAQVNYGGGALVVANVLGGSAVVVVRGVLTWQESAATQLATAGTSVSAALSGPVATGDFLAAVIGLPDPGSLTTAMISDTAGNANWAVAKVSGFAALIYCPSSKAAAGGITVTVSSGASGTRFMALDHFTATTSPVTLGQVSSHDYTSANAASGDTGSVTASGGSLLYGGMHTDTANAAFTAVSPDNIGAQTANSGGSGFSEYLAADAAGTETLSWASSVNVGNGGLQANALCAEFIPAIGGVLAGTISGADLGGTISTTDFGGGVTGWSMQQVNLNFAEFNDITLNVSITSNGSALNLTGYTVNMLLKPLAGVLDSDGRVLTLSSAGGSPAITITNAATGACTVAIPHADLQDATHTFYRIDAVDASGNINTAIYGNITYTSL